MQGSVRSDGPSGRMEVLPGRRLVLRDVEWRTEFPPEEPADLDSLRSDSNLSIRD